MMRILALTPWLGIIAYQALGGASGFRPEVMQLGCLVLCLGLVPILWYRRLLRQASDLEIAVAAYLFVALLAFWVFPGGLGRLMSAHAATALYGFFFLVAALPPRWGREPFTCHFARRHTPPTVWRSALFQEINLHLTIFWAGLFALSFLVSLAGDLWAAPDFSRLRLVCAYLLPLALMSLGAAVSRWYPAYRRRRLGPLPIDGHP